MSWYPVEFSESPTASSQRPQSPCEGCLFYQTNPDDPRPHTCKKIVIRARVIPILWRRGVLHPPTRPTASSRPPLTRAVPDLEAYQDASKRTLALSGKHFVPSTTPILLKTTSSPDLRTPGKPRPTCARCLFWYEDNLTDLAHTCDPVFYRTRFRGVAKEASSPTNRKARRKHILIPKNHLGHVDHDPRYPAVQGAAMTSRAMSFLPTPPLAGTEDPGQVNGLGLGLESLANFILECKEAFANILCRSGDRP